jgi:hypothetical protein
MNSKRKNPKTTISKKSRKVNLSNKEYNAG